VAVEPHQEAHLVGRAGPVLGRERVGRDRLHPDLDAALDHVEQRRLPCLVSLVRGSPCCFAQRPLPSMTIATWRGTSSLGRSGGRAPEGGGLGGGTRGRPLPRAA